MILNRLELKALEIPFHASFKHASAERASTETIIAIAHSQATTGYGEGCPRGYVTGESLASCRAFLDTYSNSINSIHDLETLRSWIVDKSSVIDTHPAAWCAIEMAILDILSRETQQPIESLLGVPKLSGEFRYTAVLGVSSPEVFDVQLDRYRQLGFTDYKFKVSGDLSHDRRNIQQIASLVPECRIRLDANNLWNMPEEVTTYIASLNVQIWAIEEPLQATQYSACRLVAQRLGCRIILDESFLRREQLAIIKECPRLWIPNIRVSKVGGLLRALEIARDCRILEFDFIIGAHVGETSLLTRAALCLAQSSRDRLIAQEGAFGSYLMSRDVTNAPIMFGENGIVSVKHLRDAPGWGFEVSL